MNRILRTQIVLASSSSTAFSMRLNTCLLFNSTHHNFIVRNKPNLTVWPYMSSFSWLASNMCSRAWSQRTLYSGSFGVGGCHKPNP